MGKSAIREQINQSGGEDLRRNCSPVWAEFMPEAAARLEWVATARERLKSTSAFSSSLDVAVGLSTESLPNLLDLASSLETACFSSAGRSDERPPCACMRIAISDFIRTGSLVNSQRRGCFDTRLNDNTGGTIKLHQVLQNNFPILILMFVVVRKRIQTVDVSVVTASRIPGSSSNPTIVNIQHRLSTWWKAGPSSFTGATYIALSYPCRVGMSRRLRELRHSKT